MKGLLDAGSVVVQIAFRNLLANRWKTLIVGGIIGFGAFLVVLGTSLLDSVDRSMSRSIIGSVAGNIQVYSSQSKEELDVMGGFDFDANELEPIPEFARVRQVLLSVPNVMQVVPMGINGSMVLSGNTVDQALAKLRQSVTLRQQGDTSTELERAFDDQKNHVRQIISVLKGDAENVKRLHDDQALITDDLGSVERAASDGFWSNFDADPLDHLEFLENRIAPLATDADMLYLRYVGTDPKVFARSFDRMKVVEGQVIPAGQRGFMFSKYTYEEQVKLKTARGLDKIHEGRTVLGKKIATDENLQRLVREASLQVKELLLQLDAPKTRSFREKLRAVLHSNEADVGKLLSQFLNANDGNFDERYAFFYQQLAPSLELYRVRIGDTLTIKAFTRSGYVQSANLKVYGVFAFNGLERSPQAGTMNMMDLVSFRELYGFMTEDRAKEIAAMRRNSGAKEISRENAESELFGAAVDAASETAPAATDLGSELSSFSGSRFRDEAEAYDPRQLEQGVVLNAAVLLKDEDQTEQTVLAIEAAGRAAGLPLKAITWQKASGLLGQFATLMRVVLYTAVLIIFVVALVIINNALVMATLERVREIGTLRAVGAQRRFILAMLLLESVALGLSFGAAGTLLGAGTIALLGRVGIAAGNQVMMFFFSGPRLYPAFASHNLLLALGVVLLVSVVSSIYPAWIAMRISPREAMQAEE